MKRKKAFNADQCADLDSSTVYSRSGGQGEIEIVNLTEAGDFCYPCITGKTRLDRQAGLGVFIVVTYMDMATWDHLLVAIICG